MQSLITLLAIPLILLNTLGGIVAFIWLAILGHWSAIGYGILFVIGMPWLFSIAQLPGIVTTLAAAWFHERHWRIPAIGCIFITSLWTSILIVAWCSIIVFRHVHLISEGDQVPMLLWGYTVALAPLSYMASKEPDNIFTGLQILLAQLFVIGIIGCWVVSASLTIYVVLFAITLFAFPVLTLAFGIAELVFRRSAP